MRFSILLLLSAFIIGLCTPNVSYAAVNTATSISLETEKDVKKAEKRQKKIDKKLDRVAKMVTKRLGISEAKYKEMSTGLKVTLIVLASILTVLLIFSLIFFLIIKPIINAE